MFISIWVREMFEEVDYVIVVYLLYRCGWYIGIVVNDFEILLSYLEF